MASEVLQKTRKINKTLQTSGGSNVSFDLLAGALGEVLNSNVYVVSAKGKVTAKKAGKNKTVTITAMSTDGTNKKARVRIKIR